MKYEVVYDCIIYILYLMFYLIFNTTGMSHLKITCPQRGVMFMFRYVRYTTVELRYPAEHHSLQTVEAS